MNESEHFTLYSANQQWEKVKTKLKWYKHWKTVFLNIEQIWCKTNVENLSIFAATLSITSGQIKNKRRRDLKNVITKTLEEKLDDEERTEEQKCEVFKQILENLNYYTDDTTTGNSNQPKEDSTQKHCDTTTVGEHESVTTLTWAESKNMFAS